jgi:hypothetical protein
VSGSSTWRVEICGPGQWHEARGGAPARPGAGGHGLWPVSGATHIRVPGATGKEREGERRLAGGAARGIGHIRQ